jgi:hypothetical protein
MKAELKNARIIPNRRNDKESELLMKLFIKKAAGKKISGSLNRWRLRFFILLTVTIALTVYQYKDLIPWVK